MVERKLTNLGFVYDDSNDTWCFEGDFKFEEDFLFFKNFVITGNFEINGNCVTRNLKVTCDAPCKSPKTKSDNCCLSAKLDVKKDLYVLGNLEACNVTVGNEMKVQGICNAVDVTAKTFFFRSSICCLSLKNHSN